MVAKPLVSVIIPVYNAGHALHNAIASLRKQHYTRLEIIMINDSSEDNSLKAIYDLVPALFVLGMITKVISHEYNQGVASARNSGLEQATGEFIYFLDADDYLEPDAIALLVIEASSGNADIVGCNWFLTFEKNERRMNQPAFRTPLQALEAMMRGSMRWNLWLFMVRRSLYTDNHIRFIPGMNMGEDLMMMMKLFVQATRVSYVDKALYHYGQANEKSLTKIYSDAHMAQVTANVKAVEICLLNSSYAPLAGSLDFLKLNIKLPLLISDEEAQYKRWLAWFAEANAKVMANKALPFRTRLIQWLAVKKQFWGLKLYYGIVTKFVYGTLYK